MEHLKLYLKEKLQINRVRNKLEKNLGSISEMTRLPGAIFIVDTTRENIAVKEAKKLKIPIFAMVDTNSDPKEINYVIPANDDASKSINKILDVITSSISEGLEERKIAKNNLNESDLKKMKSETIENDSKQKKDKSEDPKEISKK